MVCILALGQPMSSRLCLAAAFRWDSARRWRGREGWQSGGGFGVPVYLYEAAATRPDRVNLEDVRRGQFEGLLTAAVKDAMRQPDVGGPELHRTAGASAVGARKFL